MKRSKGRSVNHAKRRGSAMEKHRNAQRLDTMHATLIAILGKLENETVELSYQEMQAARDHVRASPDGVGLVVTRDDGGAMTLTIRR